MELLPFTWPFELHSFIHLTQMSTYRSSSHRVYFQKVLVSCFLLGKCRALTLLRARDLGMKRMESYPLRGSYLPP